MKNIITILFVCVGLLSLSAQEGHHKGKRIGKEFHQSLNETQKQEFKGLRDMHKGHMEAMKVTFTADQKAIMDNGSLSMKAKKDAIRSTLTPAQKEMKKKQREEAKVAKDKFVASLSDEQKKQFEQIQNHRRDGKGKRGRKGK